MSECLDAIALLITHYSLLITHYSLLITRYLLLVTCYSLLNGLKNAIAIFNKVLNCKSCIGILLTVTIHDGHRSENYNWLKQDESD